ncbi:MAG: hypothetical protein SFW66_05835 [Gammaproteobacteria bacterium]|nr:hypothetical protein [Gammaproteobacteria bacterium]
MKNLDEEKKCETIYEVCDTLFYQGNLSSQTQVLKYTGDQKIQATTGDLMWCTGRNNLKPLNVIYSPYIGCEVADVNLHPFDSFGSVFNPVKLVGSVASRISNWNNGFHFSKPDHAGVGSVAFHSPVLSEVSIGQESDMVSHRKKYELWQENPDRTNGLILWGVSRGTAATFCAFSREKYPEVKLVVLEGAIDSLENVLAKRPAAKTLLKSLSIFVKNKYQSDGPSPLSMVSDFPEDVPVVFITSKADKEVPCENTENIARALAERGMNDVYLLVLENSSHPNYMFDHEEDRNCYECFIHAIYQKYQLKHDVILAARGEHLIDSYLLSKEYVEKQVIL